MSDKHTQGRLELKTHTYAIADTGDYDSSFEIWGDGKAIAWFNGDDVDEANARRLVACWNACEMASTEDLEALTRPGDVSWACTIDRLVRERDELLEALRRCREMVGHPDNIAEIDAAIAKAEAK